MYADVRPTFKIGQNELYTKPQVLVARNCPLFFYFLFTYFFSIKFLYFFIISSLFPYFNLFVSIFIQSYANSNWHVSNLYKLWVPRAPVHKTGKKNCVQTIFFFNKLGDESIWNLFLYCQKNIYIYLLLCISSLTAHALVIRIGYGSYTYFSFESRSGQTKDYNRYLLLLC